VNGEKRQKRSKKTVKHVRVYRRILAAGLVVLLAVFAWGVWEQRQRARLQNRTESLYQKSFHALTQHLDLIGGQLAQTVSCVSQEQIALSLATIWRQTFAAQASLSALPLALVQMHQTERFLSDAGDAAYWFLRRTAREKEGLADAEKEVMLTLLDRSQTLCTELDNMSAAVIGRNLSFVAAEAESAASERLPNGILDGFDLMEQKMEEYPEISIGDVVKSPLVQKPLDSELTSGQCANIALEWWFGPEHSRFEAVQSYEGIGDILTYGFEMRFAGQPSPLAYVDVTQKDGRVLWAMAVPQTSGQPAWDDAHPGPGTEIEDAEDMLYDFLKARGSTARKLVQKRQEGSYGVYTLAPEQDGVLFYPDQVKIQIDLEFMRITGFEGTPYYRHHRARDRMAPKLTEAQIRDIASPFLTLDIIRPALIQDDWGKEILTWEVQGRLSEEVFSVFYNAETGAEERAVRLTQPRSHFFAVR
jgi:spore germination protein